MAREKSINEKWRDWRLDSAFVNEKKGDDKIQVPGIGMYTYDTLKSKVQKILEYLKSEKCKIITNHDLNLKNVEAQLLDVLIKILWIYYHMKLNGPTNLIQKNYLIKEY